MSELKNELTWSVSRECRFRECLRRYYYNYYEKWGGWEQDASPDVRKVYVLSNMINLDMAVGEVVHEIIGFALERRRKDRIMDLEEALTTGAKMLDNKWRQSLRQSYKENPKAPNLIEHYYDDWPHDIVEQRYNRAHARVTQCLTNFFQSPTYQRILEQPVETWVKLDEFVRFDIPDGIPILVKPDLVWKEPPSGDITIHDWKTGQGS